MGSHVDSEYSPSTLEDWKFTARDQLDSKQETTRNMKGRVIFVTACGILAGSVIAKECIGAGANVAVLDVEKWALHLHQSGEQLDDGPDSISPILCGSWINAVEEVISQFGAISLWFDIRGTSWPIVSQAGGSR